MTNGSANFRTRQRVARKVETLMKLQEVLIDLLDEETYFDEWCVYGFPDGASKTDLIDMYEDSEDDLEGIFNIAIDLLRGCKL